MAVLNTTLTTDYDKLISGLNRGDMRTFPVTVKSGAALKRGALVTYADGKVSAVATKTDSVFGILCEDVDASKADAPGVVYTNGDFNKDAVIIGTLTDEGTIDDFILAARNVGIFLR